MIRDRLRAIVRTVTAVVAGHVAAWVVVRSAGISAADVVDLLNILCTTIYYTAVHLAESRWPRVGALLGWIGAPTYPPNKSRSGSA